MRYPVLLADIPTPYAVIDEHRLLRNIAATQARAAALGAWLRPHFKTHESCYIAELQRNAGAIGFTCSTLDQALDLRAATFDCQILLSNPVQLDSAVAGELRSLHKTAPLLFSAESRSALTALRSALGSDAAAEVIIEVEVGCRRSGIEPECCGEFARMVENAGFVVAGVFAYPGHAYRPGKSALASDDEARGLDLSARALRDVGIEPRHISAGSTPTMRFARSGVATEYRPGTYALGDWQQVTLGAVDRADVSLTVVATIIAIHEDRVVLDAGAKALGRDRPPWVEGHGQLWEAPLTRMFDHHAVLEGTAACSAASASIGQRVAVMPNNANSVMALHRTVWLTSDDEHATPLTSGDPRRFTCRDSDGSR
jgi:D-serine deaminase-like pyridoxal phosphate-dependent protein